MTSFKGTFAELQSTVTGTGRAGVWEDIANGKQFRSDDGAVLNWYPKTGTLQFQGEKAAREAFQRELALASPAASPKAPAPAPAEVASKAAVGKKVFVVHGHDTVAREQLELVLHRLKLDPFVLAVGSGNSCRLIPEILAG